MVACTSSTSAFKLLHTSPVFLHPGSPLLKFTTWHYQCYNWNEVARLFLPGAAFVSVALMVHLILSLPIMFLFSASASTAGGKTKTLTAEALSSFLH